MRGGGNRKTEIQKKGGGGVAGFLFMYLYTIITNGGQRGRGSWGAPYALPALASSVGRSSLSHHPLAATPSTSSWLQWLGREGHTAAPPHYSQQG